MVRDDIALAIKRATDALWISRVHVELDHPQDASHGDYSANVALVSAKKLKENPMELAQKIKEKLVEFRVQSLDGIEKIEIAPPGFINFWLSKEYLVKQLNNTGNKKQISQIVKNQKILVEFAHPNTHKEFHIGHLRNIAVGESICRILKASGAIVRRVNYQGDVGLHVAKAMYGLKQLGEKGDTAKKLALSQKAKLLGEAYMVGSKRYEEDEKARTEIGIINKQIYTKDPAIMELWKETRRWSLDYFELVYQRLGTAFDRLYFESEVFEAGKQIVLSHVEDGIFKKDQGAIIFDGEKFGLHKRVFVTKEGNPTYEGKEMGLGPLQYKEFPFDLAIHVVGPEQASYFSVTFKALEFVDQRLSGKERHLSYGLVQLKEGKMSSRMGNVVSAEWLLSEIKKLLRATFPEMSDHTLEAVTVGAVKYSMLKVSLPQNIQFSLKESISLEGNSGPYLQYTLARTKSVLEKSPSQGENRELSSNKMDIEIEEEQLLRTLHRFPETVEKAAANFAPNLIANYLFDLAQTYNLFYQKHKIIGSNSEGFRLSLTKGVGQVLKEGLDLLGIVAPERM